jgi:hypothetical protein
VFKLNLKSNREFSFFLDAVGQFKVNSKLSTPYKFNIIISVATQGPKPDLFCGRGEKGVPCLFFVFLKINLLLLPSFLYSLPTPHHRYRGLYLGSCAIRALTT